MVCVRFLRTQQCAKSQCLLVLDRMAGCVLVVGVCLVVGFWIPLASMILAGICLFRFGSCSLWVVVVVP